MTTKPAATDRALESEAALALIRQYLGERRPRDKAGAAVVALSGDASTRRYYRLQLRDRSFVLALYPEPFVPEAGDGGRGVVLPADLGDVTRLARLTAARPTRTAELYREAVDRIAQLQLRAAQGPQNAACFQIAFDIEKLSWELHYFQKHFLEGLRAADLTVEDRSVLSEAFHQLSQEIASWPRVLCHRDYHSRNLMAHGGRLVWIDFQDARMGPASYDLASLLRDAYVDLPEELQEDLKERFRQQAAPDEPREVFRRRYDLMCVQRNLKTLGTFGFMATVRQNPVYQQYIPRTADHARKNLARYPELERLWRTLARHVPELA